MAAKKKRPRPTTKKQKKQQQENKFFFGALIGVGLLLVIGVAYAVLSGTPQTAVSGSSSLAPAVESELASSWREQGFTRWGFRSQYAITLYLGPEMLNLPADQLRERFTKAGKQFADLVVKQSGEANRKQADVMFHNEQNQMLGTYSDLSGAQVQQ